MKVLLTFSVLSDNFQGTNVSLENPIASSQ